MFTFWGLIFHLGDIYGQNMAPGALFWRLNSHRWKVSTHKLNTKSFHISRAGIGPPKYGPQVSYFFYASQTDTTEYYVDIRTGLADQNP